MSFTNQSNAAVLKWKKPEVYPAQAIPFLTSETFFSQMQNYIVYQILSYMCEHDYISVCLYMCDLEIPRV